MNFRKQLAQEDTGFQMAPMVDIMFILLIFFMVAAIYAQWEMKLDITVPTAKTGKGYEDQVRQMGEIIINLDKDGKIFINNSEMDADRLKDLLDSISREFRDQPVIIRADAKTNHEHVVAVLDVCKEVDIWNVAFATLPEEAAKLRSNAQK